MRKILALLLAVTFGTWATLAYAEGLKLGCVNLKKVLDNYERVKDGESELLKEAEAKNAEREKKVEEIKSLRDKIDLLNAKEKEKKQGELEEKVKNLQDYTYQIRTDLRQKRDDKFMEIMKEVRSVIEEYSQSHKYNVVIDDTLLFYKDTSLEVTDDIIKILNQRYKK